MSVSSAQLEAIPNQRNEVLVRRGTQKLALRDWETRLA